MSHVEEALSRAPTEDGEVTMDTIYDRRFELITVVSEVVQK